jgi:antitoxin (DNA-binding transcriptional repressor) of toxin-antitoxin stability system
MKSYSLYEAKTKFSAIIDEIISGEECTILRHGVPVAMLIPFVPEKKKRKFNTLKKSTKLKPGWDAQLTQEELHDYGLE